MSARPAFTLIELVVVLAIVALLAGASAPLVASAARPAPIAVAGDSVLALLGRAQRLALERASAVTLTLDPATRRWWIDAPDTAGVLQLPAGATLASPEPRVHVRFDGRGGAAADSLTVRAGDATRAVIVDPWTAAIRLTEEGADAVR